MTLDQALTINKACVDHQMWQMGVLQEPSPQMALISTLSLPDLLQARDMVRQHDDTKPADANGCKSFSVISDDRLLAALYTLYHYEPQAQNGDGLEPVVGAPRRVLLVLAMPADWRES